MLGGTLIQFFQIEISMVQIDSLVSTLEMR
jgi:hypothetical protein